MVTCVLYESDGCVQPTVSAPSIHSGWHETAASLAASSPPATSSSRLSPYRLFPTQLLWEQTSSEYIEYRETEQLRIRNLMPVSHDGRQLCEPHSPSPSVSWRSLLAAVAPRLPSLLSAFAASSASTSAAAAPLSSSCSTPFSYQLFDPYAVYSSTDSCGSSSESTFSFFFRNLVYLLSRPLSAVPVPVTVGWPAMAPRAQSLCSSLYRSMAVFCAAVVLGVLAAVCFWRWLDEAGEQSDIGGLGVAQSIYSQPVMAAAAAGGAVAISPPPSIARLGCGYASFACPFCSSYVTSLNASSACLSVPPFVCRCSA